VGVSQREATTRAARGSDRRDLPNTHRSSKLRAPQQSNLSLAPSLAACPSPSYPPCLTGKTVGAVAEAAEAGAGEDEAAEAAAAAATGTTTAVLADEEKPLAPVGEAVGPRSVV
jgi:hypothetical protein